LHTTWKGSLNFGFVAIPVALYGATDEKKVSFNQLHTDCGGQVKQPKYCEVCERNIPNNEIMKGYPIDPKHGKFVPVTWEDLDSLKLPSSRTLQVLMMVDIDEVDPRFFKKSYFLTPETAVGRPSFLLFQTLMEERGLVAISKIMMKEREQLCCIRAFGGLMLVQTMFWHEELREYAGFAVEKLPIDVRELEMAGKLLDTLTMDTCDLSFYEDKYEGALEELIYAKLEGKTIEAPVEQESKLDSASLAEQLIASLNAITC